MTKSRLGFASLNIGMERKVEKLNEQIFVWERKHFTNPCILLLLKFRPVSLDLILRRYRLFLSQRLKNNKRTSKNQVLSSTVTKWGKSFHFFEVFNKSHCAEKCEKGDSLGFFELPFGYKFKKRWDLLETFEKIAKKSNKAEITVMYNHSNWHLLKTPSKYTF